MAMSDVFERFVEASPVAVAARVAIERVFAAEALDQLFRIHAQRQYELELLFSTVVDVMSLTVSRVHPSVNASVKSLRGRIPVTVKSIYNKLERLESAVSRALVQYSADQLEPVIRAMGGRKRSLLKGYRLRILDGNHLSGTEHRLKELRTTHSAPLPGLVLAVLDYESMLITDCVCCTDAYTQERALLDDVLQTVQPKDVFLDDRNFCTTKFLFGLAGKGAFFITRQHSRTLTWAPLERQQAKGKTSTGRLYEQRVRLTDPGTGDQFVVRRVTLRLNTPTRDGDTEIHLLTNLPVRDASARKAAETYRRRWTLEQAFQHLTENLRCEVHTLCYPKAALFAFCVAVASYNVLSLVQAALRSVHGEETADTKISHYYLADELRGTYRGMMIAVPPVEWTCFRTMAPRDLARLLKRLAGNVHLPAYQKSPRGPKLKRPTRASGKRYHHLSTARVLAARTARE